MNVSTSGAEVPSVSSVAARNCAPLPIEWRKTVPPKFKCLSAAEERVLRSIMSGSIAYCGEDPDSKHPSNDPATAENWNPSREIRADFIRWLCVEDRLPHKVDPTGIFVHGAKITDDLNLAYIPIGFPITFLRCVFEKDIYLNLSEIPHLRLDGSWINTLHCDGMKIQDSVFLTDGFRANGLVSLVDANIGGTLDCDRAELHNLESKTALGEGFALYCNRLKVRGDLLLRGLEAWGEISLTHVEIGGDLVLSDATIMARSEGPFADRIFALGAQGILVHGDVLLDKGFCAAGAVNLSAARVSGALDSRGGDFSHAKMDLRDAVVGTLRDDGNAEKWPSKGNLQIDGLKYDRLSEDLRTASGRLQWLDRQPKFVRQPFVQLASVLKTMGDEEGSITVLMTMEQLRDTQSLTDRAWRPLFGLTVGYGYRPLNAFWGLAGLSALGWILYRRSYLAGTMVPTEKDAYGDFKRDGRPPPHYPRFVAIAYSLESALPLIKLGQGDKWQPDPSPEQRSDQTNESETVDGQWSSNLLRLFRRVGVFLEKELGTSPQFLRWFLWVQIVLGWALATLFVAGVTGIIHGR